MKDFVISEVKRNPLFTREVTSGKGSKLDPCVNNMDALNHMVGKRNCAMYCKKFVINSVLRSELEKRKILFICYEGED